MQVIKFKGLLTCTHFRVLCVAAKAIQSSETATAKASHFFCSAVLTVHNRSGEMEAEITSKGKNKINKTINLYMSQIVIF